MAIEVVQVSKPVTLTTGSSSVVVNTSVNKVIVIAGPGTGGGGGGGGGVWGSIIGTLSNQTDLQAALNAKLSGLNNGNGTTYNSGTTTVNWGGNITANVDLAWAGNFNILIGSASATALTPTISLRKNNTSPLQFSAYGFSTTNSASISLFDPGTGIRIFNQIFTPGASSFYEHRLDSLNISFTPSGKAFAFDTTGGLNLTIGSDTTGDTWYRNSSGYFTRIPLGANNTFFTIVGSIPTWSSSSLILGGNLTTSGAFATTITVTAPTTVTLPTTGNIMADAMVSNGLTATSTTLKLGGALTGTTTFTGAQFFNFQNSSSASTITISPTATPNAGGFALGIGPTFTMSQTGTPSDTLLFGGSSAWGANNAIHRLIDVGNTVTNGGAFTGTKFTGYYYNPNVTAATHYAMILNSGSVGISTTAPTAVVHIASAVTATAGTAPLKFATGGTLLSIVENGAIEVDASHIYFSIGGSRYQLDQQAGGGGGTVTSVAWTTSQGVSASIATPSSTPNITVTLGALTGVTSLNGLVVTANTGVITSGTWNATLVAGQYGGTGVNNSGKTITLGGNLTTSGAFNTTFTVTGSNTIIFPNAAITVARTDAAQTFIGTQTFSPTTTVSGLNVGSFTSNPSVPNNGDIFYDSAANALKARIAAAWVSLGSGGSGAPFADNAALIKNNADNTKLIILDASLLTTATTRTWKFPDVNGTVARNDAAQTFAGVQTFSAAPVFSVAFTLPNGTIATTQASADNSTKVATTAYVDLLTLPNFDTTHDGYVFASGSATKILLGDGSWTNALPSVTTWSVLSGATGAVFNDDSAKTYLKFIKTASAVNYTTITNSATGFPPTIGSDGTDTNIGLTLTAKGTGLVLATASGGVQIGGFSNSSGTPADITIIGNSAASTATVGGKVTLKSGGSNVNLTVTGAVEITSAQGTGTNTSSGKISLDTGAKSGTGTVGNISLFSLAGSFGSGEKVMFIGNRTTAPSGSPTGGGVLYVESGALKFKGSSGTVTTVALA